MVLCSRSMHTAFQSRRIINVEHSRANEAKWRACLATCTMDSPHLYFWAGDTLAALDLQHSTYTHTQRLASLPCNMPYKIIAKKPKCSFIIANATGHCVTTALLFHFYIAPIIRIYLSFGTKEHTTIARPRIYRRHLLLYFASKCVFYILNSWARIF